MPAAMFLRPVLGEAFRQFAVSVEFSDDAAARSLLFSFATALELVQ